jgi:hypothetical protein
MIAITPSSATPQNVARQPNICPINVPRGTPVTVATVSPVNISAIALPFFSGETSCTAIVAPIEKNRPCENAVMKRAISNNSNDGESAATTLPMINTTISDISKDLRLIRDVIAVRRGAPTATPMA